MRGLYNSCFFISISYVILKINMEFYDYNRVCDDAVISTITTQVVDALSKQIEKMKESVDSPYVQGIDGLANYLCIGKTIAQELKNSGEIPYSQRGRLIWFRKADIDKFMQRNRA